MERISHPQAKEAFDILKSMSATAQERKDAERRIAYVRQANAIADYHWDEGKQAGIKIGREEGKAEGIELGTAKGRSEATKDLLVRMLERKFGQFGDTLIFKVSSNWDWFLVHTAC